MHRKEMQTIHQHPDGLQNNAGKEDAGSFSFISNRKFSSHISGLPRFDIHDW